jgi:hypothetical protein
MGLVLKTVVTTCITMYGYMLKCVNSLSLYKFFLICYGKTSMLTGSNIVYFRLCVASVMFEYQHFLPLFVDMISYNRCFCKFFFIHPDTKSPGKFSLSIFS